MISAKHGVIPRLGQGQLGDRLGLRGRQQKLSEHEGPGRREPDRPRAANRL